MSRLPGRLSTVGNITTSVLTLDEIECLRWEVTELISYNIHSLSLFISDKNFKQAGPVVHLHVEDCSEELLRQPSNAIKNQKDLMAEGRL